MEEIVSKKLAVLSAEWKSELNVKFDELKEQLTNTSMSAASEGMPNRGKKDDGRKWPSNGWLSEFHNPKDKMVGSSNDPSSQKPRIAPQCSPVL